MTGLIPLTITALTLLFLAAFAFNLDPALMIGLTP